MSHRRTVVRLPAVPPVAALAAGLLTLLLSTTGCGRGGVESAPARRPIVLISIDTLRSDRLPAYGYDGVETPALDALREDSILFERAYAHVPLTLPSHASLLTGLLPPDHGVRDNAGYRLAEEAGTTLAERLGSSGYATGAAVSAFVMRAETGLARGFDHYDDELSAGESATIGEIQRPGGRTLDAALEWLDTLDERPFFLLFHIYEPHTPWTPPPELAARYGDTYDGDVAAADAVIGRLVAALRERDLYERSTVIVLSDHGEGLGDHGETEHGVLLYREDLQVPLLVKLPGNRRAGSTVAEPVQLVDVAPTVLELAGLEPMAPLPGTSLLAVAAEDRQAPEPARALYAETFHPQLRFGWSGLTSVVMGDHHYIEGGGRGELFDVVADPAEKNDVLREDRRSYARLRDALRGFDAALEPPFEEEGETRDALAALGYLGGTASAEGDLPDPRQRIASLTGLRDAVSMVQRNENEEAIPLLRRATEEIPRSIDAWQFLGLALERTGAAEEAYAVYQKAFELSNGSPLLAGPMGRLAFELQRWKDAAALLALAAEGEPEALEPRLMMTRAYLFDGQLEPALAAAREAVEVAPESAVAHYQLGAVRMGLQDGAAAELSLRRALELEPEHTGALSDLAVLLMSQGRRIEARAVLERLVELQPGNPGPRRMMERLDELGPAQGEP
jgi:arylsulfatase A-like enzyme/Flp pilus assembly protein TadD